MGNCNGLHRIEKKSGKLDLLGKDDPSHEGIKTVEVRNSCGFTLPSEDLTELIGKERKFDLLVVGLQEAPGKSNIAKLLQEAFAESHILLGQSTLQSLKLFLFGGKNTQDNVKEIRLDKQPVVGCGGCIGRKKGAVAIYINVSGIRMVFISCHLSAHKHKVETRNSQCRQISDSLFLNDLNVDASPTNVTVWLGDLNYRLEGIGTHPARNLIYEDRHEKLTDNDQLLQEAERGQVFKGYFEGNLSFKPTYKYNVGSDSYDTSYKIRVPSWTDRILFKTDNVDAVLSSYESIDCIKSSDHKPVRAHLCLRLHDIGK